MLLGVSPRQRSPCLCVKHPILFNPTPHGPDFGHWNTGVPTGIRLSHPFSVPVWSGGTKKHFGVMCALGQENMSEVTLQTPCGRAMHFLVPECSQWFPAGFRAKLLQAVFPAPLILKNQLCPQYLIIT